MTSKVVVFARMNPPTRGHELLLESVATIAKDLNGAPVAIHLSKSHDAKKNPLEYIDKLELVGNMMPTFKNLIESALDVRSMIDVLKYHSDPDLDLHLVAGEDRLQEYKNLADKYNHKEYHYKSVTVHSAGSRDPDSEGTEGMSATKLRMHALLGEFNDFSKGLPSSTSKNLAEIVYEKVRKGMNIIEDKYAPDTRVRRKTLLAKLKSEVIARNLNRQAELKAQYGDKWKDHMNQVADYHADRAMRGKTLDSFVEDVEKVKEKKKKKTKIIINPSSKDI